MHAELKNTHCKLGVIQFIVGMVAVCFICNTRSKVALIKCYKIVKYVKTKCRIAYCSTSGGI